MHTGPRKGPFFLVSLPAQARERCPARALFLVSLPAQARERCPARALFLVSLPAQARERCPARALFLVSLPAQARERCPARGPFFSARGVGAARRSRFPSPRNRGERAESNHSHPVGTFLFSGVSFMPP